MAPEAVTHLLLRALRRVLSPLVRFMLVNGVSYPQLTELLKGVFVEVAEREFRLDGKVQTDSRISLLTGIHRKDVKRLRETPVNEAQVAARAVPLSAQVLGAWLSRPGLQDAQGRPLPLPRSSDGGDGPSFDALVTAFSKDIRPRALLDEWARQGMVCVASDDRIHLNAEAFVPQAGFADKLYYYGHNLHDHLAAATHNLCEPDTPFLERSVHYDGLPAEAVAALAAHAERRGMTVLYELNAMAAQALAAQPAGAEADQRFTCGLYFFNAPHPPEAPAERSS